MATTSSISINTLSEVRRTLPAFLRKVRKRGKDVEPIIYGSYRHPEAVVMPYEAYRTYLDYIDELAIARIVEERLSDPQPKTLDEDEFRRRPPGSRARARAT